MSTKPSVVVLGGGTGTYMMLQALKRLPVNLTAILTMVDDGGSNKILRDQFGLLPTSGITQCIAALSENETLLRELFTYRYQQGEGIKGMRFGNLFLAAVTDILGSQKKAIKETLSLLNVKGNVIPISYDDVRLVATYEDGTEVIGEHEIDEPKHDGSLAITDLKLQPATQLNPEAKEAILHADFIIIGPGDFYTNTVPNFVVEGVPAALKASSAKKIFVSNLMTKYGDTHGFSLSTFLEKIDHYYGLDGLDYVIYNSNQNYPTAALEQYQKQHAEPVKNDIDNGQYQGVTILQGNLYAGDMHQKAAADKLNRSILRHDPVLFSNFFEENFLDQ